MRDNKKNGKTKGSQVVMLIALFIALAALVGILVIVVRWTRGGAETPTTPEETTTITQATDETTTEAPTKQDYSAVIDHARTMAAMYDYDGAIEYLKENHPEYEMDSEATLLIGECNTKKSKLVKWANNSQITHIFFHSLIMDCDTAFASSSRDNYNKVMTTIDEFNKILEEMHKRGYVLVSLHDIASIDETTGQMTYNPIYLPEGKIPFVLSQDDLSYYEYMKLDGGFPDRLIVTEDGKVMNEVDNADGTKTVGAFDVVPLLDEFVEKHPDFSYHGAKGTVALTGYNGILGYRTSYVDYASEEVLATVLPDLAVSEHYDYDYAYNLIKKSHSFDNLNIEADREKAAEVAAAMRANGWDFASHTWGHTNMGKNVNQETGDITSKWLYADTTWWKREVETIIGDTDIIIFAFGADIGTWRPYSDTNQALLYLKSQGFNYFCNVDSSQYYVQISATAGGSGYLRQGRRNLDGTLMFKSLMYPELHLLDDLFDTIDVYDANVRPRPVLGVTLPDWYDGSTLIKPSNAE